MTRTSIAIFVLAILSISSAQLQSACTTPDHREGVCKTLKKCAMLLSCIMRSSTTNDSFEFLQQSHCGYDIDNQPLVCCETTYLPATTHKTANPCYPEVLPRVSNQLPNQCGDDALQKVYGRERSRRIEFPWMVMLHYDTPKGSKMRCAGALISDRHVLTAAHCVAGCPQKWNLTQICHTKYSNCSSQVGQTNKRCVPTVTLYPIQEKIIHEEYHQEGQYRYNDIALLKLATPLVFNDTVAPICLPGVVYEPQKFSLAAWDVSGKNKAASDVQMKVALPLSPREPASNQGRNDSGSFADPQMCSGSNPWRRNSGGPLMALATDMLGVKRWTIFGLASYGPKHCNSKRPGIYTKISPYIEWILSKIK